MLGDESTMKCVREACSFVEGSALCFNYSSGIGLLGGARCVTYTIRMIFLPSDWGCTG